MIKSTFNNPYGPLEEVLKNLSSEDIINLCVLDKSFAKDVCEHPRYKAILKEKQKEEKEKEKKKELALKIVTAVYDLDDQMGNVLHLKIGGKLLVEKYGDWLKTNAGGEDQSYLLQYIIGYLGTPKAREYAQNWLKTLDVGELQAIFSKFKRHYDKYN